MSSRSRSISSRSASKKKKRQQSSSSRGKHSKSRSKEKQNHNENIGNVVHVRNLSTKTDEEKLKQKLGKYGNIIKCEVIRERLTKISKRYGFIYFEKPSEAESAVGISEIDIDGSQVRVEMARRPQPRPPTPGQYLGSTRNKPPFRRYQSNYRRFNSRSRSRSRSRSNGRSHKKHYRQQSRSNSRSHNNYKRRSVSSSNSRQRNKYKRRQ